MRILVAEDDFSSRISIVKLLSAYGEVDVAVNGTESVKAFKLALQQGNPYHLLCLDIKMPAMDGREVLKQCRKIEAENSIDLGDGAKIIMTTVLDDKGNIFSSFKEGCEGYIVKPITEENISAKFKELDIAQGVGQ